MDRIKRLIAERLAALTEGSIVTTPFTDVEGNVAEKDSHGLWLITGEERPVTNVDLAEMTDTQFVVLRRGYLGRVAAEVL